MTAADHLLRELAPQVLGAVVRRYRDFGAAEDAVQEALLAAALQWPGEGLPANPRGWLIQVASRRMTDHLRTELARRRREAVVVQAHADDVAAAADRADDDGHDDRLRLLFMCCHPALSRPSAQGASSSRRRASRTSSAVSRSGIWSSMVGRGLEQKRERRGAPKWVRDQNFRLAVRYSVRPKPGT